VNKTGSLGGCLAAATCVAAASLTLVGVSACTATATTAGLPRPAEVVVAPRQPTDDDLEPRHWADD
jgi:hypothetical protein